MHLWLSDKTGLLEWTSDNIVWHDRQGNFHIYICDKMIRLDSLSDQVVKLCGMAHKVISWCWQSDQIGLLD